ncbi:MAG: hypothetical protein D6717_06220, partial [Gammaproteobacteria bacterium]
MLSIRTVLVFLILLAGPATLQAAPRVVATILPIQSIAARIMQGVGQVGLLLPATVSPHDFSLRPSQRRQLEQADLILWAGPELEGFMPKVLASLPPRTRSLALLDACCPEPATERHHHHDRDPHFWLDPRASIRAARAIATTLQHMDPANAERYRHNLADFVARAEALERELRETLRPLQGRHLVTWHDAYGRFARRFGLDIVATVALDAHRPPGARHVRDLRRMMQSGAVDCLYREAQFRPRLIDELIAGTSVHTGQLDPLGAGLKPGPDAWAQLLRRLAGQFLACREGSSDRQPLPQHQTPDHDQ